MLVPQLVALLDVFPGSAELELFGFTHRRSFVVWRRRGGGRAGCIRVEHRCGGDGWRGAGRRVRRDTGVGPYRGELGRHGPVAVAHGTLLILLRLRGRLGVAGHEQGVEGDRGDARLRGIGSGGGGGGGRAGEVGVRRPRIECFYAGLGGCELVCHIGVHGGLGREGGEGGTLRGVLQGGLPCGELGADGGDVEGGLWLAALGGGGGGARARRALRGGRHAVWCSE